ncbi:MAG: hypothetical protein IMF09_02995 [Proteobacteria bacterium]|nr:hypothetical protein [Pseudomonadota bacterium]
MNSFSSGSLDKASIAKLIPHAGNMVLLDTAESIETSSLQCRSNTHLDASNPLRTGQGLSAISGIEYAAQAMALHMSLVNDGVPQSGLLAICKNIKIKHRYFDAFKDELHIAVEYLNGSIEMGLLQYGFTIFSAAGKQNKTEEIISGELSIVIQT